jgi:ribonuclease HII
VSAYEFSLWKTGARYICGVDEVGRGPLAGPVTAAAVVMPAASRRNGIADSKTLSQSKREVLAERIKSKALSWSVASVDPEKIDEINILQASLLAMRMAVESVTCPIDLVLVDGIHPIPDLNIEQETIRGGDGLSICVGAASVIAKVERDRLMSEYDQVYPVYKFAKNKGYPTLEHRRAIHIHGPCEIHRKTFRLLPEGIVQGTLSFDR